MVTTSPRIYVVSLSDYNAGRLHGCWIDASQDADEIHDEIAALLRGSKFPDAEEWEIHDYEGFGPLKLSKSESIEKISELGKGIEEYGEAFALFAANQGGDVTVKDFEEAYIGAFDSEADWAEKFLSETGYLDAVPDELRNYIDFEDYARDVRLDGRIWFERGSKGDLHAFWNL